MSLLTRASDNIPTKLKPVLAVFLNLGLSTLLGYLAAPWIASDLAAIDRPMKEFSDYSSLIAWRVVEVLGYWIGGWDATQAASLSALSLAPGLHYFHTYHPSHAPLVPTLATSTAIDILSVYLPMRFLRPRANKRDSTPDGTHMMTALLTSVVYQLLLQVATKKFLTSWLLENGWVLESVAGVHTVSEGLMLTRAIMMLPIGWAATEVIFSSETEKTKVKKEDIEEDFSGLFGVILKLWMTKLSPRTRKVVKRTLLVAAYQTAGASAGVAGTVKGGNIMGATGLSGVWAASTIVVGAVLGWVGRA
ncbi:hypothetical protein FPQ18DRAFT_275131 [Pyronema domesticum]|uniref:Uncharacterized protein n=1 Tax=Pyronema omphalodes (strain CBS 100304) TaxID=1076935 RepID=U4LC56_PYROM|nr:hypothetical protein FPQ18DRAFT_275131 [Pyronema domesticum]CCX17413.1 Similar to hypothetical protein [Tuber melanosporum Mel28]; acc. no. XP_002835267 [Pyronema omphalodes CBS 100304]